MGYFVGWTFDDEGFLYKPDGTRCSTATNNGYRSVRVDGKLYYQHRVICFLFYGEWFEEIDHYDRVRDNNRISNLRPCDRSTNSSNRSGYVCKTAKGIYQCKQTGRWRAYISHQGKQIKRRADSREEALRIRDELIQEYKCAVFRL